MYIVDIWRLVYGLTPHKETPSSAQGVTLRTLDIDDLQGDAGASGVLLEWCGSRRTEL